MEACKRIAQLLEKVRNEKPLVHQITNYVTVNDCANITLALGASPVMADDILEVSDMVSIAKALVINIGTLNSNTIASMILAGKTANKLNIPVVLDPVGVGATKYRTDTAKRILDEVKISVIRGNLSEIKILNGIEGKTKGVDSTEEIFLESNNIEDIKLMAKSFAKNIKAAIAITGAVDIITDGETLYTVENGHSTMAKVTGTGCMCTALIGSFMAATNNSLLASLSGVTVMGLAGEIAFENLDKVNGGTGSLKVGILDAICNLNEEIILRRVKINEG
ncbi:hydroxyethylthiazole kinase [Clostridium cavendishii DSM 21758]|uniref:Hydroxyethylthiazole kinase n=1 Tax=Clostridium cavendishii DSM 21758 TaxID=1121302 RepID=A0A1M6EEU6_9CLOT|nr:hydroxyethylthiazole kinase [Clostridium cavendishii]SHI84006.1 hydroxyethylthiazole kinase [Clostridium cavendishii DSM 21758]